jgi:hypothetical protein
MKLSDAILLGSTVLAAQPGRQYFSENEAGCALGMAAIANGCRFHTVTGPIPLKDRRTLGAEGVWGDWVLIVMARPCHCWRFRVPREMRIKDIIAHLFDYHVVARKNWTLDQLVAWVKTVEPQTVEPRIVKLREAAIGQAADLFLPNDRIARWRQQAIDWKQDTDEWQQVRQAFESRYNASRKTRAPGLGRNGS